MGRGILGMAALVVALSLAPAAQADSFSIQRTADLRFGRFAVFASGWRSVGASGAVSGSGIMAVAGSSTGPAQFTLRYDRGSTSTRPITVAAQVMLIAPGQLIKDGVVARLSAFESDLPGGSLLVSGMPVTVTIANCTTRVCTANFAIGARIDVDRQAGGADLTIPLPVTAILLAVL